MVVLSLAVFGFWLIVLVIQFEIRKREYSLAVEIQRDRHQQARTRLEEVRASIEQGPPEDDFPVDAEGSSETPLDGPAVGASPLPQSLGASHDLPDPLENPTPAQIAALVAPNPKDDLRPPEILSEAQRVAREQPEVATAAIRRLIAQDPRTPRSLY